MRKSYAFAAVTIVLLGVLTASIAGRSPQLPEQSAEGQETAQEQGETAAAAGQFKEDAEQVELPPQWLAIDAHNEATRGPRQPIPFSHRFHSTDLGVDCMYCHIGTERSVSGVVPPMDICMGCHRIAGSGLPPIEELRGYDARGEPIPWEWVNKLPEFVQFSHRAHLRNAIACEECHGPVAEMDRVYQWASFTMGWCLDCHRGEPAETDVATDHLLAAQYPAPATPERDQEHSLNPLAIDMKYGASRAPIDCTACHF